MKTTVKALFVLLALGFLSLPQPARACGGWRCKSAPTPTNPACLRCEEDPAATNSTCIQQAPCSCVFVHCSQLGSLAGAASAEAVLEGMGLGEIGLGAEPQSCPAASMAPGNVAWAG